MLEQTMSKLRANCNVTLSRALYLLRQPVITEKSMTSNSDLVHVFEVDLNSNKNEIAEAAELIFNIAVKSVRTLIRKGKSVRFKGMPGKRSNRKLAIIVFREKLSPEQLQQPIK